MAQKALLFDLDGTLLDHESYSFAPARPALAALAEIGAGVVLATSKTAAEVAPLRAALGLAGWPQPLIAASDLTLLVGLADFITSEIKAAVFGMLAGLTACYLGLNAKGGPKGVGDAVNQTVVFAFMALFVVNVVVTAVGIKLTA